MDEKSADKSQHWIDTWRSMEELYRDHPDKLKAIGEYYWLPWPFSMLKESYFRSFQRLCGIYERIA
jgi:hypothetical protein